MKKILLTLAALFGSTLTILAQNGNLLATFKTGPQAGKLTLTLASTERPTDYSVDFGDGNIVRKGTTEPFDGWDGSVDIEGTPAAGSTVKIYSGGTITYLEVVGKATESQIETADLTKLTQLTELDLHANKLTTIDLSQNTKLKKLDLSRNELTALDLSNNTALTQLDLNSNTTLSALDLSNNTALTKLTLSKCLMPTLDLSGNKLLRSCYLLDMGLTNLTVGEKTASGLYLSVNNNKLTTLDLRQAKGLENKGKLFAANNNLTELLYDKIGTANLAGNKFSFATLPVTNINVLTYAPQQPLDIVLNGSEVDLSAQQADTYKWYDTDGNELAEGTDYTAATGKFTFLKTPAKPVYCVLESTRFPKFVGSNAFKTVTIQPVGTGISLLKADNAAANTAYYTLDGSFAGFNKQQLKPGIYVAKNGKKAVKVVVK